jgi:hypothetical protein
MEFDAGGGDRVDVGSGRGSCAAVSEQLPLVDANVVHNDQQDVWQWCLRRTHRAANQCDSGQRNQQRERNQRPPPERQ